MAQARRFSPPRGKLSNSSNGDARSPSRGDYAGSLLAGLIASVLYFLLHDQLVEQLPVLGGMALVHGTLNWPHQVLAVIAVVLPATVFGAQLGKRPKWLGPSGLLLLGIGAIPVGSYLKADYGIDLEPVPVVFVPAVVLAYALIREKLHRERDIFVKEMALRHKDILLRTVFENTYDSIFVVSDQFTVIYVNDAALGLFGRNRDDVIGRPVDDLCPQIEAGDAMREISYYLRIAKLEKAQIGPHPSALLRQRGPACPIELTVSAVCLANSNSPFERRRNERFLYVCNFWDAGVRKKLEFLSKVGYGDDVIAHRSMAEFVATMSHELRTPLNAIIGFAELLDGSMFGELTEKQQEYVGDISASANHLLKIINDILDISKVESGKAQLQEEEVNVAETIESCVKLVERRAEQSRISLRAFIDPEPRGLFVDKRKIKQVLINLLSNAVKFTRPGGAVEVEAKLQGDGSYTIAVSDTGIGMRAKDIAIALAPFGQVESGLDRKYEGTGLGLPLAQSLTEAHGGYLTVKSRHNIGTTVTVFLPSHRVCEPRSQIADTLEKVGWRS